MRIAALSSPDAVATRAAGFVAEALREAVGARGTASLMLAGGSTPRLMYLELAKLELPWDRVRFFFGDERAVAPDDADSNFRMAREALLTPLGIAEAAVERMRGEAPDLAAEAARYAAALPDTIDILLLGLGEDGHTASLFPCAASLGERVHKVLPVIGPKPPPRRLTVTPPVIEAAREVVLLATGAGKAEALARTVAGPRDVAACPAQLACAGMFFVDEAAHGALGRTVSQS